MWPCFFIYRNVFVRLFSSNYFSVLYKIVYLFCISDFPTHVRSSDEFQKCLKKIDNLEKENKSLRMKLHAVEESIEDDELPSDHKVALSDHVSLRLRRNSNNIEIDKLRQQLHLIKLKIETHKRAWISLRGRLSFSLFFIIVQHKMIKWIKRYTTSTFCDWPFIHADRFLSKNQHNLNCKFYIRKPLWCWYFNVVPCRVLNSLFFKKSSIEI